MHCLPRLGEFRENKQLQELAAALLTIQKYLGCKNVLQDDATENLISDLLEFFPEYTIAEIDRAVRLASNGQLDIDDNEHYEKFGSIYLSKILKVYRNIRNKVVRRYQQLEVQKITDQQRKLSPEEIQEIHRNGCILKFEEFKKDGHCYDFGNAAFNFLRKIGLIEAFTEEAEAAIRERALERMRANAALCADKGEKKAMFALVEKIINDNLSENGQLVANMKTIALNDYFLNLTTESKELAILIGEKIGNKPQMKPSQIQPHITHNNDDRERG